ncbi:hypothetical protein BJV78DRAFT_1159327 [Lactifluus subvellereus]|nr:hypothetical protein BJV78DRAFT_1159327 [Lactifluus subvellereus]
MCWTHISGPQFLIDALRREAVKRGEINPKEAASLANDPSFIVELEHSHTDLPGDLQSGLSTSETPSGFNASLQHSVFAVTPTYSLWPHDVPPPSPVSLTTENALTNSKHPRFFINPTHGSYDGIEGDPDLSLDWEYHKVHAQPIMNFFPQGPSKKRKPDHESTGVTVTASLSEVTAPTTNHLEVSEIDMIDLEEDA